MESIVFSPNGSIMCSGSSDKTIKIWNVEDSSLIIELKGHKNSVNSIAFNPDGKILASGSGDKTIIIWNLENG